MTPAGYVVKGASGFPALFIDKDRATDKAVTLHGTVTPLFSLRQVINALERAPAVNTFAEAIDFLVDEEQA